MSGILEKLKLSYFGSTYYIFVEPPGPHIYDRLGFLPTFFSVYSIPSSILFNISDIYKITPD